MCKKVRDLVYSDTRIQVEETAQALSISHGSVLTILHDHLDMHKLTARGVPKSLSDEQMTTRASVCRALLERFRSKDGFLLRLVTVDETWVHYYEPEDKAQSRPRGQRSSRHNHLLARRWLQYFGTQKEALLCLDILLKRSTITGVNYANLRDQLSTAIRETRRGKGLKVFCCNRTTRESTLAKLQWMLQIETNKN